MSNTDTPLIKRILAALALLFFLGVFVSLVYCLFAGAGAGVILAHLFCLIVIPCIFYIFQWFRKITTKK